VSSSLFATAAGFPPFPPSSVHHTASPFPQASPTFFAQEKRLLPSACQSECGTAGSFSPPFLIHFLPTLFFSFFFSLEDGRPALFVRVRQEPPSFLFRNGKWDSLFFTCFLLFDGLLFAPFFFFFTPRTAHPPTPPADFFISSPFSSRKQLSSPRPER